MVTQDTKTKRRGVYNAKTEYEVVKRNDTAALLHITPHNGTDTNTQKSNISAFVYVSEAMGGEV